MATILQDYTPETRAGRPPKYPWDKWLDGKTRRLGGRDFSCSPSTFSNLARRQAAKRGRKLRIYVESKGTVVIQPLPQG